MSEVSMSRRQFAVSLGLAKESRGRMSAAAYEAIAKAEQSGKIFSDTDATPRKVMASAPKAGQFDAKKVREWAKANNLPVNARGRLSAEILEAYKTANPDVKPSANREHISVSAKDIRPHAAPTRSPRTEFTVFSRNKTVRLSGNEACKCGYSLSYCNCGSPVVWGLDVEVKTR